MTTARKRVVVLISGRGTNLEALIAAARDPDYPVDIVGVISNRADAKGLVTAQQNGVEAKAIAHADYADKSEHEAAVHAELTAMEPDIVCLAGYMRILSADFVAGWIGRMINIHPSLLPAFPGLHTHQRALEAGCRIHGCTVHFVTEVTDMGPIIAQAAVPVLADDTDQTLSARVLAAEHQLYPLALALVAAGNVRLDAGRTAMDVIAGEHGGAARLFSPSTWRGLADLEALARQTP
jgi:phosphoribosylglycinamide formyltransferase 1